MFPCPAEPCRDCYHEYSYHDWPTIVHIRCSDGKGGWEGEPDSDIDCVEPCKNIHGTAPFAPVPLSKSDTTLAEVACVYHAADGNEVARVERQRRQRSDRPKSNVARAANIEKTKQADDKDAEEDGSDGDSMLGMDLTLGQYCLIAYRLCKFSNEDSCMRSNSVNHRLEPTPTKGGRPKLPDRD